MITMRLQKYMAKCGVASRRQSEKLIETGHVRVNDMLILTPGYSVDLERDSVFVDGQALEYESYEYILLNKPVGVVSTVSDRHAEKTVLDLVESDRRLYPVGRLDRDTSGLIILTNDGDLTYHLTHPSHTFNKKYECLVKGHVCEDELFLLRNGIKIPIPHEEGFYTTCPANVTVLSQKRGSTLLQIIIHEGKNRQIRKMCDAIGHSVISLKRIALGEISDSGLKPGEWRLLTEAELEYLKEV